ncbi:MAG: DUF2145 domain-containing protein [Sulfuricella sp.]|nr:DUF2145 domain-containing protein [Sulfuricella sp.]
MSARLLAYLLLCLTLCFSAAGNAGQNCNENPNPAKTQKAIRFATQVRDTLELSGAHLAVIGRVGSDQSKRGVRYTHVGYAFRDHPAGPWTVVHQLNGCGSGNSDLFDDGLANFFMDDPFDFETRIVIPSPPIQESLAKVLLSPTKRALHEASYSSIANPWATKYQNSNGWVLEIYAAAAAPGDVESRASAQRWLRGKGYRPSQITIGGGERAGARLFSPNVHFGDHPDSAWQTQRYEVNTGDSVFEFIRATDTDSRLVTQRLDARPAVAARPMAEPRQALASPYEPPVVKAQLPPPGAAAPAGQSRAQILQAMQGLIVPYACRQQGYLQQCRRIERRDCEQQINDAILRCFATVSDQQLFSGPEQEAMQQMQEIGYCAVEAVDSAYAKRGQVARNAQGNACPSVRNFK